MKRYFYIFSFAFLLFVLICVPNTLAQEVAPPEEAITVSEAPTITVPSEVTEVMEQAVEIVIKEEAKPVEIRQDEAVNPEDLGVEKAKILPDSPFYRFKEWGRGIKLFFTFDPVKKAETQLAIANAKLIEAKQLIEEKRTEEAVKTAGAVIEDVTKKFDAIVAKADDIKRAEASEIDKFLDKTTDHQLKQQKLLQKLGEQVPEEVFIKIEENRERHLEKFAEVMTKVAEKPEVIKEKLVKITKEQPGSDYKGLKQLEILKNLEEKMPTETREAVIQAQESIAKDLEEKIGRLPEEVRTEKISKYMEFMPGNAIRQFEVLDKAKGFFTSPEMIKDVEFLKDKAVRKFEEKFAQLKSSEAKGKLIGHLKNGDPEDMRTLIQMEMRIEPPLAPHVPIVEGMPPPPLPPGVKEMLQKIHEESVTKFKERFAADPEAFKKAEAVKKALSNPDAVDFKLLQKIEESLPVEQKEFVKQLKEEARKTMIDKFGPPPKDMPMPPPFVMEKFVDPTSQSFEVLKELKEILPPEAQGGIEQAIQTQIKIIGEHLEKVDDPVVFERYKRTIEKDKEMKRRIQKIGPPNFFRMIESREKEMGKAQEQFEQAKQQKIQEMQQEIFQTPLEALPSIMPVMPPMPSSTLEKMKEYKKEMMEKYDGEMPTFVVPPAPPAPPAPLKPPPPKPPMPPAVMPVPSLQTGEFPKQPIPSFIPQPTETMPLKPPMPEASDSGAEAPSQPMPGPAPIPEPLKP